MASKNDLDDATLDRIFDTDVRRFVFGDATRQEEPVVIFVGAQPGAGKTRAGQAAMAGVDQEVIPIVGDDLRAFHPDFERLLQQDPAAMPDATAQTSGAFVERAIDYAAANGISVLVEGTFRRPQVTIDTAQKFRAAGFRVEVHFVAVAPEVSHESIASRYVNDKQRSESARFTSLEAHDASFAALPDTLRAVSAADAPVDRIVVRTRDGLLMDHTRTPGHSIRGAMTMSQKEWDRPRTPDELNTWRELTEAVIDYFDIHLKDDENVQRLSAQLHLDRQYLDLRADGSIVVRGHLREGYPVRPHVRKPPRRS